MITKQHLNISSITLTNMMLWITQEKLDHPTGRGSGHPSGSQHTVKSDRKDFKVLFDTILSLIKLDTGRDCYYPDIWINYLPPNGKNGKHNHMNVDIGGCFYLTVPKDSGMINFETGEVFLPLVQELVYWNADKVHWVNENMGTEDRISIAFNIKFL